MPSSRACPVRRSHRLKRITSARLGCSRGTALETESGGFFCSSASTCRQFSQQSGFGRGAPRAFKVINCRWIFTEKHRKLFYNLNNASPRMPQIICRMVVVVHGKLPVWSKQGIRNTEILPQCCLSGATNTNKIPEKCFASLPKEASSKLG